MMIAVISIMAAFWELKTWVGHSTGLSLICWASETSPRGKKFIHKESAI